MKERDSLRLGWGVVILVALSLFAWVGWDLFQASQHEQAAAEWNQRRAIYALLGTVLLGALSAIAWNWKRGYLCSRAVPAADVKRLLGRGS